MHDNNNKHNTNNNIHIVQYSTKARRGEGRKQTHPSLIPFFTNTLQQNRPEII